jgi:hypothetical protein
MWVGDLEQQMDEEYWHKMRTWFSGLCAERDAAKATMCYQCGKIPLTPHVLICAACFTERQGSS